MPATAARSESDGEPMSGITIGLPGHPAVPYTAVAGPLAAALNVFEANHPWIVADSTTVIGELMNAGVVYPFDTLDHVFRWARVRLVSQAVLRHASAAGAADRLRTWYRLIEAQRTEFRRVGELVGQPQVFTCLGIDYTLVKSAANHYYASRDGHTVLYNGRLTDTKARSIVRLLHENRTATDADTGHVDEFVCAFLAEPTRWPEEQAFNLLALHAQPADRALTGNVGTIVLPMTSGSTYEPATGRPGAQVPRRTLDFADKIGLTAIIDQEIQAPTTNSVATFRANVLSQYL